MISSSSAAPAYPPPEAPAAPPSTAGRSWLLGMVALVLLAVGPLLPTLRATFVYDDTQIISGNTTIRGWSALAHVWGQPYWPNGEAMGLYRPLHVALLSTIYNAGGGAPIWFHLHALGLAALTSVAVWWLLRRAVGPGPALVAALWFAAQPLHVEAIASVANSSELLVVLFTVALVAVLARVPAEPARPGRDWGRAALVGLLSAAAVLSKESGIIALPLAALSVWGWNRRSAVTVPTRTFVRTNLRAWIAGALCVGTALAVRAIVLAAAVAPISLAPPGLEGLTTIPRVRTVLSLWPRIAQMLVWPAGLSPLYGVSILPDHRGAIALASVVIVAALGAAAAVLARRGDRRPLVALVWVGLAYLPASNLFGAVGPLVSDRTLFGATVGAAMALAWALDMLPPFSRRVAMVLCALAIARGTIVATRHALDWTNHRMLWTRLVELYPEEHVGHHMLGLSMWAHGDTSGALVEVGRGLSMSPADAKNRTSYGRLLYETGRYRNAAQVLAPLMRTEGGRTDPATVAYYFDAVGRSAGAPAVVRAAKPLLRGGSAPVAALYMGLAHERLGRLTAADSAYRLGLRASPRDSVLLAQYAKLRARLAPATTR
jgi:hypothetical protein